MIKVIIPPQLRTIAGGQDQIDVRDDQLIGIRPLESLIIEIDKDIAPGIRGVLVDSNGKLKDHILISINGKECRLIAEKEQGKEDPEKGRGKPDPLLAMVPNGAEIAFAPRFSTSKKEDK